MALTMHPTPVANERVSPHREFERRATIRFAKPIHENLANQAEEPRGSHDSATPQAFVPHAPIVRSKQVSIPATLPKARSKSLLDTFASNGLKQSLLKTVSDGGDLAKLAQTATGTAGLSAETTTPGQLKDLNTGVQSQSVGPGTEPGVRSGSNQTIQTLGRKSSVQISVGGLEEGSLTGNMDREAIRRVIQEHIREIRSCYERELQRSPDLHGKLVLQWYIEEDGSVSSASPKSDDLKRPEISKCIVSRLSAWRFPNPPRGQIVQVAYPFVFSSR
jgi:hypothetical protein